LFLENWLLLVKELLRDISEDRLEDERQQAAA